MGDHGECAEELSREVYARFGLAYFLSECLHRGLCNVHTFASFAGQWAITRERVEEKLAYAFSLTLGQVRSQVEGLIPTDLLRRIEDAVDKRNYLAHSFWFERVDLMLTEAGKRRMLEELDEYCAHFAQLDEAVKLALAPKMRQLGLTDEMLHASMVEELSGRPWEPLLNRRKLRKKERIIRIWEAHASDGLVLLFFETADGCIWQLCDVGLGWSFFESAQPDWKESDALKPYLPVDINPRPECELPWQYDIELGERHVFWVTPGLGNVGYRCGVRRRAR
ncbi:hypothetical protein HQ576_00960 [bacterium]|nr:hypothetical protein [bacterium]